MSTNKILLQWDQTAGTQNNLFLALLRCSEEAPLRRCMQNRLTAHHKAGSWSSARVIFTKVPLQAVSHISSRTKLGPRVRINSVIKTILCKVSQCKSLFADMSNVHPAQSKQVTTCQKHEEELLLCAWISLAYLHNYSFLNVHIFKCIVRLAVS